MRAEPTGAPAKFSFAGALAVLASRVGRALAHGDARAVTRAVTQAVSRGTTHKVAHGVVNSRTRGVAPLAAVALAATCGLVSCGTTTSANFGPPTHDAAVDGANSAMHNRELAPWRALWNYGDPVASEARLRTALAGASGFEALEIETQVARALGLQQRFDEARVLLTQVDSRLAAESGGADRSRVDGADHDRSAAGSASTAHTNTSIARTRVEVLLALEHGRVERSSGHPEASPVHFERAFQLATAAGLDFLAIDAAHMLGIVAPAEEARDWNTRARAIALESPDPLARGWAAVSLNNQGWNEFEAGQHAEALRLFELALVLRRERPDQAEPLWIARWSVARVQRALGRVDEALAEQLALLAEREAAQSPDGYVFEELGECCLALGHPLDARPWFERASEMLAADTWLAANEPDRLARLARLAAGGAAD